MTDRPLVAVFRPDDERTERALAVLDSLGVSGLSDPMLEVVPTGNRPREDADYTIITSKTGAELLEETAWPKSGTLCAIGDPTAAALRKAGYSVDIVPETFSSSGLVEHLGSDVAGTRVEVARSDHGSPVLLDGLEAAGAYVHETILYRLIRPDEAGISVERAGAGELAGALFTSSLTVEHFLEAATERGIRESALAGLDDAVVGAIGEPTADTARAAGIQVDVIPGEAEFEALARTVVNELRANNCQ